jgi:predicted nuclease of predicted toxin-antitoxin system
VRVLLDEQLPVDLAAALQGHSVDTVVRRGWTGVTNGELLRRMATAEYDALVTMDRGIEFQQNLATVSVGILLVRAPSNRMVHLLPLVPAILEALPALKPGQLHRIGG